MKVIMGSIVPNECFIGAFESGRVEIEPVYIVDALLQLIHNGLKKPAPSKARLENLI